MELRNDADVEGNSRVVICHSKNTSQKMFSGFVVRFRALFEKAYI